MSSTLVRSNIVVGIVLLLLLSQSVKVKHFVAASPVASESEAASLPRASGAPEGMPHSQLPLRFEANHGQTDSRVMFVSQGDGYGLFLTRSEAVLALSKPSTGEDRPRPLTTVDGFSPLRPQSAQAALRMKIVGASAATKLEGLDELPGRTNYFIGNNRKKWRTDVPAYARVQYKNAYPGINIIYYGRPDRLEYDFAVAPGADPAVIKLAYKGARSVRVDARGDLVLDTGVGEVRQLKPAVYQEVGGARRAVSGGYVLKGKHLVGFQIGPYDKGKALIIDPVLAYSTYLGGSGFDVGVGIAVDSSGNAYVTGSTGSIDFPVTSSGLRTVYAGGTRSAYVAKLNPSGSALIYSTYLGGSMFDGGTGISVDSVGNAYVVGFTQSVDFPTANALQPALRGVQDAFVAKLNPSGSALVYSTYLGGSNSVLPESGGAGIAVDSSGNAYVTGSTNTFDFPTVNPLQPAFGDASNPAGSIESDAFVAKLNPSGSALVYSTYLGGNRLDTGSGIAVDSAGYAYVIGTTFSRNFPVVNALQPLPGGSAFDCSTGNIQCTIDAYVAKLNPAGSALVYSTYLGGSGDEQGRGIAVDSSGNVYVTGQTNSHDFPTANAFQAGNAGGDDAFVAKINSSGTSLTYSTYLGGGGFDSGARIALDSSGDAYVVGVTRSTNFPVVSPLQATLRGPTDAFVTKFNATGTMLFYSTYFGGSGTDGGINIAVDSAGSAYIVGNTNSADLPLSGPLQSSFGGGLLDAFVAKISSEPPNRPPIALCKNLTRTADNNCLATVTPQEIDNGSFDPDGDSVALSLSPTGPFPLGITTVTLTVTDNPGASSQCSATLTVIDNTPPVINGASASPAVLWPPNHKMVEVAVSYNATDNCDPASAISCDLTVSSNEPPSGTGDGHTSPDWEVVDAHHVQLRAERSGGGDGRIYTITITCTDRSNNSSSQTVTVTVPHDHSAG
jgi:hypothetical protein